MDEQVKVCPECGAEFFASMATECNKCEAELVDPEMMGRPSTRQATSADPALVCIEEGSYDRANEVAQGNRRGRRAHEEGALPGMRHAPYGLLRRMPGLRPFRRRARRRLQRRRRLWKLRMRPLTDYGCEDEQPLRRPLPLSSTCLLSGTGS